MYDNYGMINLVQLKLDVDQIVVTGNMPFFPYSYAFTYLVTLHLLLHWRHGVIFTCFILTCQQCNKSHKHKATKSHNTQEATEMIAPVRQMHYLTKKSQAHCVKAVVELLLLVCTNQTVVS